MENENRYISSSDEKRYLTMMDKDAIIQRGGSWDDLPKEIKDYIYDNASDENPIPFTAESIEKITNELGYNNGK